MSKKDKRKREKKLKARKAREPKRDFSRLDKLKKELNAKERHMMFSEKMGPLLVDAEDHSSRLMDEQVMPALEDPKAPDNGHQIMVMSLLMTARKLMWIMDSEKAVKDRSDVYMFLARVADATLSTAEENG